METRQIHVRDLSTVTGIQQIEHAVQSIYFLGLEDFEGDVYISIESDDYSNEAIPLTNNTFIIGQPMTLYNTTYTCQIYGVVNDGEKIQLSKRFRLIVDKSNDIQGESSEYPIDPNFENSIIEFVTEQKSGIATYTDDKVDAIQATGDAVIASIPSDYSTLEQATYNAYPTQSESGNPIYFDDGADDIPVKELIVNLEPKQSGTGDPSPTNVRPISGYDGVTVKRNGKNLYRSNKSNYTYHGIAYTFNSDGSVTLNGTATDDLDIVMFGDDTFELPPNTYMLSGITGGSTSTRMIGIRIRNTSTSTDRYVFNYNGDTQFQINNDDVINRIYVNIKSGVTVDETVYPMIRLASVTDSTFEPYTGQEYSITFPSSAGTVYGGTLNVTTGELTVDKYMLHIDETKIPDNYIHFEVLTNNVRVGSMNMRATFNAPDVAYNASNANVGAILNWTVERSRGYSSDTTGLYFHSVYQFYLFLPKSLFATQDAAGFKAYLQANPLYVVYPLATPQTYQLTPTEISTLLGDNTISSDGSMDLSYREDTTKVIERLTNAIISLGGNV